jgi:hypothetical protein
MRKCEILPEPPLPGASGGKGGFDFAAVSKRLTDRLLATGDWAKLLPEGACPDGVVLFEVILHPERLTRSAFPRLFFERLNLTYVASRRCEAPRLAADEAAPPASDGRGSGCGGAGQTFAVLVRCHLDDLFAAPGKLAAIEPGSTSAFDLDGIASIRPIDLSGRLKSIGSSLVDCYDVALHVLHSFDPFEIRNKFLEYAATCGFNPTDLVSGPEGGLIFVQVKGDRAGLVKLSLFVLIRDIWESPPMSHAPSPGTSPTSPPSQDMAPASPGTPPRSQDTSPPSPGGGDGSRRGGFPSPPGEAPPPKFCEDPASAWPLPEPGCPILGVFDAGFDGLGALDGLVEGYLDVVKDVPDMPGGGLHGILVCSAALFGRYPPTGPPSRPFFKVHAARVIDGSTMGDNPTTSPHARMNVIDASKKLKLDAMCLSNGPAQSARDGYVSHWTATLDRLAYELRIPIIVAAGNNGSGGPDSPDARIQVPSDGFNVICVGWLRKDESGAWQRAAGSPFGPGLSPAFVKPDLVADGGYELDLMTLYMPYPEPRTVDAQGSSFAGPGVSMRFCALKEMSRGRLNVDAQTALMVHFAERGGRDKREVGWGLAPSFRPDGPLPEPSPLVFQDAVDGDRFARAPLAELAADLPPDAKVKLKATLRYLIMPDHSRPDERGMKSLLPFLVRDPDAAPGPDGRPAEIPFFTKFDDGVHWPNTYSDEGVFAAGELKRAAIDVRRGDRGIEGDLLAPVRFALAVTAERL